MALEVIFMKRSCSLVWFLTMMVAPCFAHHMAVVVNKDNHVADVTTAHLAGICRLETKKWADGKDVVLVLRKDSAGELATLEHLTHMSESEWKAFVSSHKDAVTWADSDEAVLRIVETVQGAVGFVDVRSINDRVSVLKVGGKLPMEEGYLSH
jgi:ABC-type phosphate transport system substrate-binding protein